ncbi:MAG: hypothetical protein ACRDYD_03855 [Acidimicrobiales bacterium]
MPTPSDPIATALALVESAESDLAAARAHLQSLTGAAPPPLQRGAITDALRDSLRRHYPAPMRAREAWEDMTAAGISSHGTAPVQQVRVMLRRMEARGEVERAGEGLWRLAQVPDKPRR